MSFLSFQNKKSRLFFFVAVATIVFSALSFFVQKESSVSESEYNDAAVLTVFAREKCSHCQDEKSFLSAWKEQDQSLEYQILDIEKDNTAAEMFKTLSDELSLAKSTPITIIGKEVFVGFDSPENMGSRFQKYYEENVPHPSFSKIWEQREDLEPFSFEASTCDEGETDCAIAPVMVTVPFWGEVDISAFQSPTLLSFLLGFIDGFNPCAMWVLIVFILALIQIGDRFRMFVTVGIFLFAEAIMYGLILTLWFTTWNFVGLEQWVTPIVGLVAMGSGFFFLHEGLFSDGTCKVTNVEQKKRITQKIHDISHSPLTLATLFAILLLAFSVNIIEFACSFGIPQTFTQILHLSNFSLLEKIWYIVLYIFAYMIDDLIVFGIALYSIEKIGLTYKYAKASNVIGGLLMLALGLLLMFAPEILTF